MSNAHVVIGANYGDEGKGLVIDYLVHNEKVQKVVRFNGGAQAGHTVVSPDGMRHVSHHFSSGTILGADTFLSRHFVANPMIYFKEEEEIRRLGIKVPKLFVDPRVLVSTPYDMIINELREKHYKYGSCCTGFSDTIDRNNCKPVTENSGKLWDMGDMFHLNADDVYYNAIYDKAEELHYKLQLIRKEWVPLRLQQLGIPYTHEMLKRVMDDKLLWKYLEDLTNFGKSIAIMHTKDLSKHDSIVFEGGQGLGLDQEQGTVPHVTKSYTGMTNVRDICKEANIKEVDVYYVTRAYRTNGKCAQGKALQRNQGNNQRHK
jgi:adenylosuccinate synthase